MSKFFSVNALTKKEKIEFRKKFGKVDVGEIEKFIRNHLVGTSYVSKFILKDKVWLQLGSKDYPLTYWVDSSTYIKLSKMGQKAELPKEVLLHLHLGLGKSLLDLNSEIEFIDYLDDFFANQNELLKNYLPKWKKVLKTSDTFSTLEAIDKILKGRRKIPGRK